MICEFPRAAVSWNKTRRPFPLGSPRVRKTKYAVELTEDEWARPRTVIGSRTVPGWVLGRARILLKPNRGDGGPAWADAAIAGAVEVGPATVARVRRAYDGGG